MNSKFSNAFSLTDAIADIIRERILKGEYAIGEKIKENQISTELRVSRTPIREAFKILEDEGLLDYIPNRGCFAKGFTQQDIDDIYSVRKALERIAVERSVERINEDEIQKLLDLCDLMEFYTNKKDTERVLEINASFHDIIYNATGSRFIAQVLRSYKEYIEQTVKALRYDQESLEEILLEHRAIANAVSRRDAAEAVNAIDYHLLKSQERAHKKYSTK